MEPCVKIIPKTLDEDLLQIGFDKVRQYAESNNITIHSNNRFSTGDFITLIYFIAFIKKCECFLVEAEADRFMSGLNKAQYEELDRMVYVCNRKKDPPYTIPTSKKGNRNEPIDYSYLSWFKRYVVLINHRKTWDRKYEMSWPGERSLFTFFQDYFYLAKDAIFWLSIGSISIAICLVVCKENNANIGVAIVVLLLFAVGVFGILGFTQYGILGFLNLIVAYISKVDYRSAERRWI